MALLVDDLGSTLSGMDSGVAPIIVIGLASVLIFGFLCSAIAQNKGQSAGGWFIVGALLGVIGFLLVLIAPRQMPPPPQPPGWYPDPWGQSQWRWWDGYQWTWHQPEAQR